MKKMVCGFLIFMMVLVMAACGMPGSNGSEWTEAPSQAPAQPTETPSVPSQMKSFVPVDRVRSSARLAA
ncbi:MAG: hypothetical protein ACOYI4_06825 [Christensenellales bacterium]